MIDASSKYEKEKAKEIEKYNFGALKKYFYNQFYGGNEDADL